MFNVPNTEASIVWKPESILNRKEYFIKLLCPLLRALSTMLGTDKKHSQTECGIFVFTMALSLCI